MSSKAEKVKKSAGRGAGKVPTKPQVNTPKPAAKGKQAGWEWAPFTVKSVAFNEKAKRLANAIHRIYGDGISIAQFEKFCIAAGSLTDSQKALVYVDKPAVLLLAEYQKARDERDAERQSFRSDAPVTDIQSKMATLIASLDDAEETAPAGAKRARESDDDGMDEPDL